MSKQTISTITDKVMEGMAEWQNRPLDPVYPVIFIDAMHVKIRDGQVANRPIYVALAVTCRRHRDILGLWAGDGGEGAKYWLQVLTEIKNRGVEDVLHGRLRRPDRACPTRSARSGRRRSPRPAWSTCSARRSATPAASTGTRSPRRSPDLHRADRQAAARTGSWSSAKPWGASYPAIVRLWENAWAEFVPFLPFDAEIRTIVCTTNAIESVNARIRRAVRARGHFPNEAAALKCVYMAVMSLDPTGTGRKRWTMRWKPALQAFDIAFDGRLTAGRR